MPTRASWLKKVGASVSREIFICDCWSYNHQITLTKWGQHHHHHQRRRRRRETTKWDNFNPSSPKTPDDCIEIILSNSHFWKLSWEFFMWNHPMLTWREKKDPKILADEGFSLSEVFPYTNSDRNSWLVLTVSFIFWVVTFSQSVFSFHSAHARVAPYSGQLMPGIQLT